MNQEPVFVILNSFPYLLESEIGSYLNACSGNLIQRIGLQTKSLSD